MAKKSASAYHEFKGGGGQMPGSSGHDAHIGGSNSKSHLCSAIDELKAQHPDSAQDQGKVRPSGPQERRVPMPVLPTTKATGKIG